jgi:hypothetical protein
VLIENTTDPSDPTGTGSGRVYFNGGTISNAQANAIDVSNALASVTGMTVTGFLGQGVRASAGAGQQTTVQVSNTTISSLVGIDGIRLQASGGGIVNGTIASSTIDVPVIAVNAIVADGASAIQLNAFDNIATTAFELNNVDVAGTLQITQPDTAAMSAANNGASITTAGLGTITGNGTTPPVPPPTP